MNEQHNGIQAGEGQHTAENGERGRRLRFREGRVAKAVSIVLLIVAMQIPLYFIGDVIGERSGRSREAMEEIAAKWGHEQRVIGPVLSIPYERKIKQEKDDKTIEVSVIELACFQADELNIDSRVKSSLRHRGIFELPVYRVELALNGSFAAPDFSRLGVEPSRIFWEQATLSLLIADPRSISSQVVLLWNEQPREVQPLSRSLLGGTRGIEALINLDGRTGPATFSGRLTLQGSTGLFFAPMGRSTSTTMHADWPDPSFQGDWLPSEHSIDGQGFQARWHVASLGSGLPLRWTEGSLAKKISSVDQFGVRFIQPVDTYRMAERSIKYQMLFLTLTFATLWLMEVLGGARLHLFHYLLVGAAMCLFYLLELSLAEQMGFAAAYILATSAVVALLACYCLAILKSSRRAAVVSGLILVLYGYLYSLLVNQDYALLAGSLGLFVMLAAVMYLTRRIDWFDNRVEAAGAAN